LIAAPSVPWALLAAMLSLLMTSADSANWDTSHLAPHNRPSLARARKSFSSISSSVWKQDQYWSKTVAVPKKSQLPLDYDTYKLGLGQTVFSPSYKIGWNCKLFNFRLYLKINKKLNP
jgi:hypothetical protein